MTDPSLILRLEKNLAICDENFETKRESIATSCHHELFTKIAFGPNFVWLFVLFGLWHNFDNTAYAPVRDYLGAGADAPFYMKFLAGAITGGTGSVIGNPFDVLKVREDDYLCGTTA